MLFSQKVSVRVSVGRSPLISRYISCCRCVHACLVTDIPCISTRSTQSLPIRLHIRIFAINIAFALTERRSRMDHIRGEVCSYFLFCIVWRTCTKLMCLFDVCEQSVRVYICSFMPLNNSAKNEYCRCKFCIGHADAASLQEFSWGSNSPRLQPLTESTSQPR